MPKSKIATKRDGQVSYRNVATKLRIGTRKNGKSANLMSKAALEAVLEDKNHKKDHSNARRVLENRV